jgi:hypothetical protein
LLLGLTEFTETSKIPIVEFQGETDIPGYWGLWKLTASGQIDTKTTYQPLFISDDGKIYPAYGNDIWSRLVSDQALQIKGYTENIDIESRATDQLLLTFQNLEGKLIEQSAGKLSNKNNSYQYQRSRIEKIGIANIREAKLKRLDQEYQSWIEAFEKSQNVLPGLKHLITLRIDG